MRYNDSVYESVHVSFNESVHNSIHDSGQENLEDNVQDNVYNASPGNAKVCRLYKSYRFYQRNIEFYQK